MQRAAKEVSLGRALHLQVLDTQLVTCTDGEAGWLLLTAGLK